MKNLQKLQSKNLVAAKAIYKTLKNEKAISYVKFRSIYFSKRPDLGSWLPPTSPENWKTTERFLVQRGIMTIQKINGLRIYCATQQCVRTKSFDNAIKVK